MPQRFVLISAILALQMVWMPTLSFAKPLTAVDFFSRTDLGAFAISPDGGRIAFVKGDGDINDIYVLDLGTEEITPWLTRNYREVKDLRWASDSVLLASVQANLVFKKKKKFWRANLTEIYAIKSQLLRTTVFQSREITWAEKTVAHYIVSLLPDDEGHILIQDWDTEKKVMALYRVNIDDGSREEVTTGSANTYRWVLNESDLPALRVDLDDDGAEYSLFRWNVAINAWDLIRRYERNVAGTAEVFVPLRTTGEPDKFFALERSGNEQFRSLKVFDSKNSTTSPYLRTPLLGDVSTAFFESKNKSPLAVGYYLDRLHIVSENEDFAPHLGGLLSFAGDETITFADLNIEAGKAVFWMGAPDDPGGIYIYDFETTEVTPLAALSPQLMGKTLGTAAAYRFNARDGVEIPTYVTHPAGGDETTFAPLLVMPHGGPASRDYLEYDPFVQYFASLGYRVVQPNFRGSTGFGHDFSTMGYGEWGGAMQHDVTDAIRWAHSKGWANPDNTCVVGWSYGGYVALMAASTTPDLISCAVSTNGVSDLVAMVKNDRRGFGRRSGLYKYIKQAIGDPRSEAAKLKERSPISHVATIKDPVLLIHSDNDRRVPISQSESFKKAADRAGSPVEFYVYKELGHGGWSRADRADHAQRVEAFVRASLGQQGQEP